MTNSEWRTEREASVHDALRDEIFKRTRLNVLIRDQAQIWLSPVLIAASIILTIHINDATALNLLSIARWLLGFSCLFSVLSTNIAILGLNRQIDNIEKYYFQKQEEAADAMNVPDILGSMMNWLSNLLFTTAVILMLIFLEINF